ILPSPEMHDLRRVSRKLRELMNQLLTLLESRRRLGIARLVATDSIYERIIVKMIWNRRHAASHQPGPVEPCEWSGIIRGAEEIQTAMRLLLNQQIRRLFISTVARSAWTGVHVVAETAIYAIALRGAERCATLAGLAKDIQFGSVHKRSRFLNADHAICAD